MEINEINNIGFVGLGVMGMSMFKNLSKSKISLQEPLKSNLESYFVEDIEKLKIIMPKHKIDWLNNGKTSQNIS